MATLRESWPLPSFTRVCLNFSHFDILSRNQHIWLPFMRVLVTPAVYPRVFEILTTLKFGALRKTHIASTAFEDITKKMKPHRPRVVKPCLMKCQEHNRS